MSISSSDYLEELNARMNEAEEGLIDSLEFLAEVSEIEEVVSAVYARAKDLALEEAEKYPEKSIKKGGYMFTKRNGTTRYDYSGIPQWTEKKNELKDIEQVAKNAYSLYQKGKDVVDENGEIMPMPKVSVSKDSISVKKLK